MGGGSFESLNSAGVRSTRVKIVDDILPPLLENSVQGSEAGIGAFFRGVCSAVLAALRSGGPAISRAGSTVSVHTALASAAVNAAPAVGGSAVGGTLVKIAAALGGGIGVGELLSELVESLIEGDSKIEAAMISAKSELEKKKLDHEHVKERMDDEHQKLIERMVRQHQLHLEQADREAEAKKSLAIVAKPELAMEEVAKDALAVVANPGVIIQEMANESEEDTSGQFIPYSAWEKVGGAVILVVRATVVLAIFVCMWMCMKKILCRFGQHSKEDYLV